MFSVGPVGNRSFDHLPDTPLQYVNLDPKTAATLHPLLLLLLLIMIVIITIIINIIITIIINIIITIDPNPWIILVAEVTCRRSSARGKIFDMLC